MLQSAEPLPWRPNTRPKLPPGALLDIADDLLWDLLTEWLPLEAVCRLDSALCQKRRRLYFLSMLETKVLLFNRENIRFKDDHRFTHRALEPREMKWILKRGMNLASLQFGENCGINNEEAQSIRIALASSLALHDLVLSLVTFANV